MSENMPKVIFMAECNFIGLMARVEEPLKRMLQNALSLALELDKMPIPSGWQIEVSFGRTKTDVKLFQNGRYLPEKYKRLMDCVTFFNGNGDRLVIDTDYRPIEAAQRVMSDFGLVILNQIEGESFPEDGSARKSFEEFKKFAKGIQRL